MNGRQGSESKDALLYYEAVESVGKIGALCERFVIHLCQQAVPKLSCENSPQLQWRVWFPYIHRTVPAFPAVGTAWLCDFFSFTHKILLYACCLRSVVKHRCATCRLGTSFVFFWAESCIANMGNCQFRCIWQLPTARTLLGRCLTRVLQPRDRRR